ncbi:hypothetical protein L5515_019444 [Caenorhabditis briggsae]|uniref:Tudor domain-containing protein n=2 Tax=Caenorhabditis briggsae TaxID=6238 RepID=A0AAE9FLS8_CAEBR|nr:hypothetical protein L5515_019444 [Caenorhabditis briggsae]
MPTLDVDLTETEEDFVNEFYCAASALDITKPQLEKNMVKFLMETPEGLQKRLEKFGPNLTVSAVLGRSNTFLKKGPQLWLAVRKAENRHIENMIADRGNAKGKRRQNGRGGANGAQGNPNNRHGGFQNRGQVHQRGQSNQNGFKTYQGPNRHQQQHQNRPEPAPPMNNYPDQRPLMRPSTQAASSSRFDNYRDQYSRQASPPRHDNRFRSPSPPMNCRAYPSRSPSPPMHRRSYQSRSPSSRNYRNQQYGYHDYDGNGYQEPTSSSNVRDDYRERSPSPVHQHASSRRRSPPGQQNCRPTSPSSSYSQFSEEPLEQQHQAFKRFPLAQTPLPSLDEAKAIREVMEMLKTMSDNSMLIEEFFSLAKMENIEIPGSCFIEQENWLVAITQNFAEMFQCFSLDTEESVIKYTGAEKKKSEENQEMDLAILKRIAAIRAKRFNIKQLAAEISVMFGDVSGVQQKLSSLLFSHSSIFQYEKDSTTIVENKNWISGDPSEDKFAASIIPLEIPVNGADCKIRLMRFRKLEKLVIRPVEAEAAFKNIDDEIQDHIKLKQLTDPDRFFDIGQMVLCRMIPVSLGAGTKWGRGIITERKENTLFKVYLVDYAMYIAVAEDDIRRCPIRFTKIPATAIQCTLNASDRQLLDVYNKPWKQFMEDHADNVIVRVKDRYEEGPITKLVVDVLVRFTNIGKVHVMDLEF